MTTQDLQVIQKQINEAFSFSNQFFHVNSNVAIEEYTEARFGNSLCPSVTDGNTITFNKAWIEAGRLDSDDIPFFLIHELRHIYQHDQIAKLEAGKKTEEDADRVKVWQYEWPHYIHNLGDPESRLKNLKQEIEMDANGYALALMYLRGKRWPPMIRVEEDQFELSVQRAQDYLSNRPEIQTWIKEHQR